MADHLSLDAQSLRGRACSAEPEIMSMGHVLTCAWLRPAMPCTAPGPDTVSSTPGTPVRKPDAAAAYPAACSLRKAMKRMPAACTSKRRWL